MTATIHDVAEMSGLSLGTVSKYLNGIPIKEKNRLKVEEAVKKLNYHPNNIAKGLRTSKTFAVAVLVPMLSSTYCTTIISALEQYLLPKGYCVIVSECHDDAEMEIKKTKFLLNRMVDGIILLPYCTDGRQIDLIQQSGIPLVVIDQLVPAKATDCIVLDNEASIYKPMEALIETGHTDIAIITGDFWLYTAAGRIRGYQNALEDHGIPVRPEYIVNGHYSMSGGYDAILRLYENNRHPTAILISNYDMTIGAFLAINYLKLKVPEEVSVIGFDNLPLAQIVTPPLSIIEQPMEEMGYHAAKLLYTRMKGNYSEFPKVLMHKASFNRKDSIRPVN